MSSSHKVMIHSPLSIFILKQHLKFVTKFIYFRRYRMSGQENIPPRGTPTILVCNHQNCMIDPVALIFPLHRYGKFMTRASVFNNKTIGNVLRKIGAIPIYRMDVDGMSATANNAQVWQIAEEEILGGQTVTLFAEGKHQHKRLLGDFQSGYTRIAFEAAKHTDFAKPIFILPASLHYDNYEHMQSNLLVSFGEPLDISPYYELYQSKPRTAQRQVNNIMRDRVKEMCLDIADNDNYAEVEFACMAYDRQIAAATGRGRNNLKARLEISKKINAELALWASSQPQEAQDFFAKLRQIMNFLDEEKLRTWVLCQRPTIGNTLLHLLWQILLLPVFVAGLLPNILIYATPYLFTRNLRDTRFRGSLRLGATLITMPLIYTAWFCTEWALTDSLPISLIHTALLVPMGLLAWHYRIGCKKLAAKIKYHKHKNAKKYSDIAALNVDVLQKLTTFATN